MTKIVLETVYDWFYPKQVMLDDYTENDQRLVELPKITKGSFLQSILPSDFIDILLPSTNSNKNRDVQDVLNGKYAKSRNSDIRKDDAIYELFSKEEKYLEEIREKWNRIWKDGKGSFYLLKIDIEKIRFIDSIKDERIKKVFNECESAAEIMTFITCYCLIGDKLFKDNFLWEKIFIKEAKEDKPGEAQIENRQDSSSVIHVGQADSDEKVKKIAGEIYRKIKNEDYYLVYIYAALNSININRLDEYLEDEQFQEQFHNKRIIYIWVSERFESIFNEVNNTKLWELAFYRIVFLSRMLLPDKDCVTKFIIEKLYAYEYHNPISIFIRKKMVKNNVIMIMNAELFNRMDSLTERFKDERRCSEFVRLEEYYSEEVYAKLFEEHLPHVLEYGKFRETWDSDIIGRITDHNELIDEINKHTANVSQNFVYRHFHQDYPDSVWDAVIDKLVKDKQNIEYLKKTIYILVDYNEYNHYMFRRLVDNLFIMSQDEYAKFLAYVYKKDYLKFLKIDRWNCSRYNNINIEQFHEKIKK